MLDVGLLPEGDFGRLELGEDAGGIQAHALILLALPLRELDALLGGLRFGLVGCQVPADGGELAVNLGEARLDRAQALMSVVGALLGDLVGRLQLVEFVHALAVDGTLAFLERAFDALVLGHRFDALGVDLARFAVEIVLLLRVVGGEPRALRGKARALVDERRLLGGKPGLAALRRGDTLLLLLDGAVFGFDLLVEIALDLTLRALSRRCELGQLLVIGLPAGAREKGFSLAHAALVDGLADVGDEPRHLVLGAQLGGAHPLRLRKDRGEE